MIQEGERANSVVNTMHFFQKISIPLSQRGLLVGPPSLLATSLWKFQHRRILIFWEIGGKITLFDWWEGTTFGLSYWEVPKIVGSKKRDNFHCICSHNLKFYENFCFWNLFQGRFGHVLEPYPNQKNPVCLWKIIKAIILKVALL